MAFIELNHVTFTYPNSSEPAILDLSLKIEKGKFVVLIGPSGSGKSTLLKLLKKEIKPHGSFSGEILFQGKPQEEMNGLSSQIGYVFQDPENQVVADDVLHEMVFGLENIGLSTNEMRNRVAEMVNFFGAESLLDRKTHELSGGKKQQINLASVLLMQPDVLLLDEPTAQLDPVSAREFLDMLKRLNEEFGMTIIIAEHRLEEVFTLADRILMMDHGQMQMEGEPKSVLTKLWDSPFKTFVPSIPSLFFSLNGKGSVPLTVKEGRSWTEQETLFIHPNHQNKGSNPDKDEVIKVKNLFYRYDRKADDVLKELNFSLRKKDFYALLGGNGSGKSTFLKVLCGLFKPEQGKIFFHDKQVKSWKNNEFTKRIGYLPQNPKLFFIQDTVEMEMKDTIEKWGLTNEEEKDVLIEKLGIAHLVKSHPYDLSGGELQKSAMACILLRKPEILLLDEPTKGLDPLSKENLADILHDLRSDGVTIIMSTHDIEFAAQHASKCGMMFQGTITSEETPENFFKGNFFYSTMIQRLFRHIPDYSLITVEEVLKQCAPVEPLRR
ncbi:ABC transporter ATP-binding protein [Bacillus sp. OK048]|uniref:ABC transporter ATP-binding protein n=1 Tax=Bacillus sp. OK048 TaxID=1882761 RepID=UPI000884FE47|nr:ABC transporter ATP-binding protein [Bacillus sp. OK048]SDM38729.1 energy-coupling factor transport system ATP-binding protein [Bacillus sp. OK048]